MNKLTLLVFILPFVTTQAFAQVIEQSEKGNKRGLYAGVSVANTTWMPVNTYTSESYSRTGTGIGMELGYNFIPNMAIFASFDGTSIASDYESSFYVAHYDIGVEGRIGKSTSWLLPYLKASFLAMTSQRNNPIDNRIQGAGYRFGGGLYFFVTSHIAFDASYTHSIININELWVDDLYAQPLGDVNTTRLAISISYHF